MILCRAPLRVSLFGGGSDYPEIYKAQGGAVINLSINFYSYVLLNELRNLFDNFCIVQIL